MKELIAKTTKRIHDQKHIDAKDLALRTILPLFNAMWAQFEEMAANVDANFADIYETLHIANDQAFLDGTQALVMAQGQFIDKLMSVCGYFQQNPEGPGFLLAEACPEDIKTEIEALQVSVAAWFQQLEAVRLAADEESLVDEEDDYDDDDDDDDDEDENEDDEDNESDGAAMPPPTAPNGEVKEASNA